MTDVEVIEEQLKQCGQCGCSCYQLNNRYVYSNESVMRMCTNGTHIRELKNKERDHEKYQTKENIENIRERLKSR